jgi:DNA repair protein RadC
MPNQRKPGGGGPSGLKVGCVRDMPLHRAAAALPEIRTHGTVDLLALLLGDAGLDVAQLRMLATRIDGAGFAAVTCAVDELCADYGVSVVHGTRIASALELGRRAAAPATPAAIATPADVAAIARRELSGLARDTVLVIACDAVNCPLRAAVISVGAIGTATMPVREILHFVLRWDASAFAVAHNHPRGACEPSDADVAATERLAVAARAVGLRFLGHVVVSGRQWQTVAIDGSGTPR